MSSVLCLIIVQTAIVAADADEAALPLATTSTAVAKPEEASTGAKPASQKVETYDKAHQVATETGKPIVVMVGADWCGPCQVMKKTILPRVRERGLLRKVAFAIVNADRERELAQKLTGGGAIPQLVMFRRTSQGWMRRKLVGSQSEATVEEFIKDGLALDEADKNADSSGDDETEPAWDKSSTRLPDGDDESAQHG